MPYNPDVDRRRLGVEALPVVEKSGIVWVFLGEKADCEVVLPPLLERPEAKWTVIYDDWSTHWTRAMENMLDSPHVPFVHAGTIGRQLKSHLRRDSKLQLDLTETPEGFDLSYKQDGQFPGRFEWRRPNEMVLHLVDTESKTLKFHVWCVPMATGTTRLLVAAELEFGVLTGIVARMSWTNRKIVFEDKAIVSSSGPDRVPHPREEKNVPTDLPTLKFRTWYLSHLEKRREDVGSVASGESSAVGAVASAK